MCVVSFRSTYCPQGGTLCAFATRTSEALLVENDRRLYFCQEAPSISDSQRPAIC